MRGIVTGLNKQLRRREKPLSVAVLISWWPADWHLAGLRNREVERLAYENRLCYAKMHNYTIIVGNDLEVSHGFWSKLVHTKRLLEDSAFDYVLYGDLDFYIVDFKKSVEELIAGREHYDVIVPQEQSNSRAFSNFVFLVKNSEGGRKFVSLWHDEMKRTSCNPKWPDQVAMFRALLRLALHANSTLNHQPLPHPDAVCCFSSS